MKKKTTVDDAKAMVTSMLGSKVSVRLNRGRNRIENHVGIVSEAHSNVFIVSLTDELFDRISCSYVDVVCGEIKLRPTTV